MTAMEFDTTPRGLARFLEDRERARLGLSLEQARESLAWWTRIAAGTFEGLRRDRIKDLGHKLVERLEAAAAQALRADIERDAHALETLRSLGRQGSSPSREREMVRLAASVARGIALIEEGHALIDEGRGE